VVIDENTPIDFSIFKHQFSRQFSKTVSELLIFCRNKTQKGQISVLYYPLCREISEEITKDPNLARDANKNLHKLSDEINVEATLSRVVDSVVDKEGMGITKRKKKNHNKKTHHKKTQKKKKKKRNKQYNNNNI